MVEFTQTLRFRLSAAFVVIVSITVGVLGFANHQFTRASLERTHRDNGLTVTRNLARSAELDVLTGNNTWLQRMLEHLGNEPNVRYATIFANSGEVLAWWTDPETAMPPTGRFLDHGGPEPIRELEVAACSVTEFDVPVITTLAPRDADGDVEPATSLAENVVDRRRIGLVRVGLSNQYLQERLAAAETRTMLFAAVVVFLGAIASLGLVRAFLRPVTLLVRTARRVGLGDFEAAIEQAHATGELEELAKALSRMAKDLKTMRQRLVDANSNLEQKVEERTQELQRAFDELKGLDRMKDDFLSSVSHEFKTPLTSIRSFTEILLKFDEEDPKTRREFLEIVLAETERLTRLVNDILDLVKIESGGMKWSLDQIDLMEVAEKSLKALRPLIDEHHLKATIIRRGDVQRVRADADRVHQVMNNLLSNAMKFSHDGGNIEVAAQTKGDFVEVRVTDQGIGISGADQSLIFERFKQVGDTLTDKPQGTGLGLPICRNIIERHGGKIEVDSAPGKGSTFRFSLPINGPSDDDLRGNGRDRAPWASRATSIAPVGAC